MIRDNTMQFHHSNKGEDLEVLEDVVVRRAEEELVVAHLASASRSSPKTP